MFGYRLISTRKVSLVVATLATLITMASATADDTEIFFGQPDANSPAKANVMFVLDTSGSMALTDGTGLSRLQRMKDAVSTILDSTSNINVGLMKFNGSNGGGPVLYPIAGLNEEVCEEGDTCSVVTGLEKALGSNFDAQESSNNNKVNINSETLTLGMQGTHSQTVGVHFNELNIPQGAKIVSARLSFASEEIQFGTAEFEVFGELSENAAPFSTTDSDISDRTLTTNFTEWDIFDFWEAEQSYSTNSITSVVQEIVDQDQWCGGNSASFIIKGILGERTVSAFDRNDTVAPTIHFTYDSSDIPVGKGCAKQSAVATILQGRDDSEEVLNFGYTYTSSIELDMPFYGSWNILNGLRFDQLNVPQGATILDANLIFEVARQNSSNDPLALRIYGEATGNADEFSGAYGYDLSTRGSTSASVVWNNVPNASNGSTVVSPSITGVVQEIVNRGDWAGGNALALFVAYESGNRNNRRWESFEGKQISAPKLQIEYQAYKTPNEKPPVLVRDRIKERLNELTTAGGTPVMSTYYEAARYFRGQSVDYAVKRGYSGTGSAYRVSHPKSYTGGSVYRDPRCPEDNLSSYYCRTEAITGLPVYTSPIVSSCVSNYIVLLSDGTPSYESTADLKVPTITGKACTSRSCATDLAEYLYTNDHSTAPNEQNIITHTIGFNINSRFLQDIAKEGGGNYYQANSSAQLLTAFKEILGEVMDVDTTFVAPSTTVNQYNRLTNADEVYFALFKPSNKPKWQGNLKRYQVGKNSADEVVIQDVNGETAIDQDTGFFKESSRSFWSDETDGNIVSAGGAAGELDVNSINQRNVYTYVGSYDDIPISGVDLTATAQQLTEGNDAITQAHLGIEGMPGSAYDRRVARQRMLRWAAGTDVLDEDQDGLTTDNRHHLGDALHSRPTLISYKNGDSAFTTIFMGTNEGYLHAFEHVDGNELFSYVPKELISNFPIFYNNKVTEKHPYGVDGNISYWHRDPNSNGLIDSQEKALIYTGLRRGGNAYYALDVSERLQPKLSWVIDSSMQGFSELGQTWSTMKPARIMFEGNETDVLIFGAGYDVNQDKTFDVNNLRMPRSPDTSGRGIYIVNPETGALIFSALGSPGGDVLFEDMKYSIPSDISILDTDSDGLADQLYAADTGGQVWRFDFEKFHAATSAKQLLKGGVIAKLSGDGIAGERRFYYHPDVAIVSDAGRRFISVSIGSGWRAHPLDIDTNNRFYMIKSPNVYKAPADYGKTIDGGVTFSPIVEADLVNITNNRDAASNEYGWYLELEDSGEKVLGPSLTADHKVFFTSYKPTTVASSDSCSPVAGSGSLYALNILNGAAVLDLNNDGIVDDSDTEKELSSSGLPPPPSALFHEEEIVINAGLETFDPDITQEARRSYWVDKGDGND